MAGSKPPVQSIDRALALIEILSRQPKGLPLGELADAAGLHVSTVHRLLGALSAWGYVEKDGETGRYRLTARLFEVGSRVMGGRNLLSVSRPFLERLADRTGETVHLVARHRDEVVYLWKESPEQGVVCMSFHVGMHNPMYCTGVGKSILAYLPQWEREGIWRRCRPVPRTEHTICSYTEMEKELERVREAGWAVDQEENEPGVVCVAAPVFDFSGTPVGAVSVSGPARELDTARREALAGMVTACTREISGLLGAEEADGSGFP